MTKFSYAKIASELGVLVLTEGVKLGKTEKNVKEKMRTNDKLNSLTTPGQGITQAIMMGSKHPHHCTTLVLDMLLLFPVDHDTRKFFAAFRVTFLMPQVCFKPITWYLTFDFLLD